DAEGSLRFTCHVNPANRRLLRYAIAPDGRQPTISNTPLVAWDVLEKQFAPTIDRIGSYDRRAALNETEPVRVFVLGEPFINALADFTRFDDRGQTFAMWRYVHEWHDDDLVAFHFNYLIEADVSDAATRMPADGWVDRRGEIL